MKLKLHGALTVMLLFCTQLIFAQSRTVTGTVTASDTKETLPGVSVVVEGTTTGTVTDLDGKYSIEVSGDDAVLVFSYIGMTTQNVTVGSQTSISPELQSGVDLDEFVVTALGISRDKKSLGYATEEVEGEALTRTKEPNIVNSLQGMVSGVQINSSGGGVGASSRIVIRGNSSFDQSKNQPLWVIDGIPVDNTNNTSSSNGVSQATPDFGDPISDLNPDDIESMNVLKGAAATSLYGSRGQNGVIIVTTKKGAGSATGKKQMGVSFGTAYSWDSPLRLPDFQNSYGQGGYGLTGENGGTSYIGVDESWGQQMDAGNQITDYRGRTGELVSRPDNVKNFFETGSTFTNNLSISGGNENGTFRLSWAGMDQKGFIPNTELKRNSLSLGGTYNLTEFFRVRANVTYTNRDGQNIPGSGYTGSNITQSLFNWFGRQVNLEELKDYKDQGGNNILNPATGQHYNWNPVYHNNPYWTLNENTNDQARNRVISSATVDWDLRPWLTWQNRGGVDYYAENRIQRYATGSIDPGDMANGGYYTDDYVSTQANYTTRLTGNWTLNEDLQMSASLGWDMFYKSLDKKYTRYTGLSIPGLYNPANSNGSIDNRQRFEEKAVNGLFATASFDYKRAFYLDLNIRNDWSSTLPKESNSYTYGAASFAWVFSETFSMPDWISFGKFRANWATVGNDTDPYNTQTTFIQPRHDMGSVGTITYPINGVASYTLSNRKRNEELKPERTNSFEIGFDLKFLKDRLGIDYAYYNATTVDQLVPVQVSGTTGFTSFFTNAGEINNRGHEVSLYATPFQTDGGFVWRIDYNFTRNRSEVVSVHPDVKTLVLNNHFVDVIIREGEEYGVLFGTAYQRDDAGNVVVGANGLAIRNPEAQIIGRTQPDFIMAMTNTFAYKNFELSFMFDWKKGGDMHSVTNWFGKYSGVLEETVINGAREDIVTQGVTEDGSANTVGVAPESYWHNTFNGAETAVYDASWIKLRRFSIAYNFTRQTLEKTPFGSLRLAVYGNNLWLAHSNVPHIDPESSTFGSGAAPGLETNALPSTRSIGVSLNVTF